jgi:hypothetical protein
MKKILIALLVLISACTKSELLPKEPAHGNKKFHEQVKALQGHKPAVL